MPNHPPIHYVEIVTEAVDEHCATLEAIHGLSFGDAIPEMGMARTATAADGSTVGVRAPMAAHETPIVRTYFSVDNIQEAVAAVEKNGGMIAYPPTEQGDSGIWAIYIQNDIQYGLWQHKATAAE